MVFLLLYCHVALLLYCFIALLLHCSIALLPHYSVALLLYCSIALLLCCAVALLLHCFIAFLMLHLHDGVMKTHKDDHIFNVSIFIAVVWVFITIYVDLLSLWEINSQQVINDLILLYLAENTWRRR